MPSQRRSPGPPRWARLSDVEEALRDARRAIEAGVGAQRAHHRRRVRPELPVRLDRIAEAGEHPLQLLHGRALHAGVQREQRRGARDASGLRGRSQGRRGEYRKQKEQQGLRRTVCEMDGSRHGFRRGQGVSWTPAHGRARWRRMRAAACRCRLTLQDEIAPVVGGLETRRADPNWNRPEPPSGCRAVVAHVCTGRARLSLPPLRGQLGVKPRSRAGWRELDVRAPHLGAARDVAHEPRAAREPHRQRARIRLRRPCRTP